MIAPPGGGGIRPQPTIETTRGLKSALDPKRWLHEVVNDQVAVQRILRGRYVRPRALEITQSPGKILDANPNRLGAFIFNGGGQLEVPLALPALNTVAIESAVIPIPSNALGTYKTLMLAILQSVTWLTAGQPILQIIAGRGFTGPHGQAAAAIDGFQAIAAGIFNIGPAASTTLIAPNLFLITPIELPTLQWHHPYLGAQITFPSAPTAGSMAIFLEMAGSPLLFIGEDGNMDPTKTGDRAGCYPIVAGASAQWVQSEGELWAAAGNGVLDCRIWEVLIRPPISQGPGY